MNHPTTTRLIGIAAVVVCSVTAAALYHRHRLDRVDELVNQHLAERQIPGACVAVLKNGGLVKAAAYGLADVELSVPATAETVFRIQSVSKQFTATGVMLLVEDGRMELDDPVSRHLDGCPAAWQSMAVRHLLAQTSGLVDFINEPTVDLRLDATEEELFKSIADRPLKFQPGDAWDYSNSNYHLLAMIIRKASGQWYGDFLADRIFKPLDMRRTAVIRADEIVLGRAMGYFRERGRLQPGSFVAPSIAGYGGGGIRSTVLDLAKWDAAMHAERLLPSAALDQMSTPVKLNNGTMHPYGFGWEIDQVANHRRIWHAGNWTGFSAQIDRYVDDQLTVIVLANLADAPLAKLAREIAGVYLPDLRPPLYRPIADKEPQMTARFFDVLRRSHDGQLRPDDFTPDVWAYLASRMEQTRLDMAAIGPIKKLSLVERTDQGDERSYRYQAQFQNTSFILHFVVTQDGKISVMMPEQVNQ